MKKCTLCKVNNANKKNSHIFPKFMGTSLLTTVDGKRAGYNVGDKIEVLKAKKNQDTPKEDYILCSGCEKKIGQFETVFANKLYKKLKDPTHELSFTHIKYEGFNKTFIPTISNIELKLFILSMLHRANISSLAPFNNCQLSKSQYEEIRKILTNDLPYKDFPMVVLTSGDNKYGENYYYGHSTADTGTHVLWVNDYIFIIFLQTQDPQNPIIDSLLLKKEQEPFLGVVSPTTWNLLRGSLREASVHFLFNK